MIGEFVCVGVVVERWWLCKVSMHAATKEYESYVGSEISMELG